MNEMIILEIQSDKLSKEISNLRQSVKNSVNDRKDNQIKLDRKIKQFKKIIETIHANDNY